MKRLYAKIVLGAMRPRPKELPDRSLTRAVEVDRHELAAYDRVCGFRLRDELPATYPHVLAFPLAMELMASGSFPFSPLGLVHIGNRIEQLRPIRADEPLDLRVWAEGLAPHERGTQFEMHGEATVEGEVVWRDFSTYLHREGKGGGSSSKDGAEPPEASAVWQVPGDIGRRYARVSGDANPIHLHPLTAKALGQPGAIAHGMWTKARCLAALEGELPDAYAVDVRFKLPLRLPARAAFSYRDGEFAVHDARSGKPHLSGRVSAVTAGWRASRAVERIGARTATRRAGAEEGPHMPYRKVMFGLAVLVLCLGAVSGAGAAAKKPPKRATIKVTHHIKVKPNRWIQDGLRWNKDVYRVRSGGTLHVVNTAADEGPHTFTVVKKKDLPRTAKQVLNCKICNTLAVAHGADPNSDAPPKFQYLENGVGQNTPPNVDRPGDSGVTGPGQEGESIDLKVTAKAGKTLHFMCLIHPWMEAKVIVGRK